MTNHRTFQSTKWVRVACAADPSHPHAQAALEDLLREYWYPVYAFLRRSGVPHERAEDLTQSFFAFVCEKNVLQRADPAKGRFRTFIIACLKHFAIDVHRHDTAAIRGGTERLIEFDALDAAERYTLETVDTQTPEHLFTQKLAQQVLDTAMRELESECVADGYKQEFTALRGLLDHDGVDETYRELASQLGTNVNTLKSFVHRRRRRLRELLTQRVEHLVTDESQVRGEMLELESALGPETPARDRVNQH